MVKNRAEGYFSKSEICIWCISVVAILISFFAYDKESHLTLAASLIGVTSLIYSAKGNPFGQLLMIVFSILYGIISYGFSYYGEMVTYLGMTAPMAIFALVSWLKHPYKGKKTEVQVNRIEKKEYLFIFVLTLIVTVVFYFILEFFNTNNLIPSTVSVTTSFLAVYLTARRSSWYAICYAANDIVLMILWILAAFEDKSYISVVVCFGAFLLNDAYGFISWRRMETRQSEKTENIVQCLD